MTSLGLKCILNPFGCAYDGVLNWYHGIDPLWFLVVGLVIGLLIGARFGWLGVLALFTLGVGVLVLRRRGGGPEPSENVAEDAPDAAPAPSVFPFPRPKAAPKPKPPTTKPKKRVGIPGFDSETGTWK